MQLAQESMVDLHSEHKQLPDRFAHGLTTAEATCVSLMRRSEDERCTRPEAIRVLIFYSAERRRAKAIRQS